MHWRGHVSGLAFSFVFTVSYFTNKFVLSVLKFTYPTLFQGWQTFIGAALLLLSGKLGWVEMSRIPRSAAVSWLPGSFLFVGNIYAGSRALSRIDIPFFFTLQNSSHVVSYIIARAVHREKTQRLKIISVCLLLLSAINLPLCDPQFDRSGYVWALCHLFCVGAYRVFQVHKSTNLRLPNQFGSMWKKRFSPQNITDYKTSGDVTEKARLCGILKEINAKVKHDIEQQCINYLFSVLLLGLAAHPTGDVTGALEFPSLQSHTFHCGCCASALLGFLLLLATVRLKRGPSLEHFRAWVFLSKVTAMLLSPLVFNMDFNSASLLCVIGSHVGEALLLYSDRESPP